MAQNIQAVFGILQVGTEVKAVDPKTFILSLTSHLNAVVAGTPLVKEAIDKIKGMWDTLEQMAADAGISEQVSKFFSILNLAGLFEDITTQKALGKGERRLALTSVITAFIANLKAAAPLLKTGLGEVKDLFGGALQTSIEVAQKIEALFQSIANAIKAGVELSTSTDWNLATVLNRITELGTATAAAQSLTMPSLGTAGDVPGAGGLETGGAGGGLAAAMKEAVIEGLRGSELDIVLRLEQDDAERKRFSARLGRIERMMATMVTKWEAGAA